MAELEAEWLGDTAEIAQPALGRGGRHDQRRRKLPPIAKHHRFGDERALLQHVLDWLRRDFLPPEVTSRSFLRSVMAR